MALQILWAGLVEVLPAELSLENSHIEVIDMLAASAGNIMRETINALLKISKQLECVDEVYIYVVDVLMHCLSLHYMASTTLAGPYTH